MDFHLMCTKSSNDLTAGDKDLLEKARAVTDKAYAPYSHFHVGAVANWLTRTVSGTNRRMLLFLRVSAQKGLVAIFCFLC